MYSMWPGVALRTIGFPLPRVVVKTSSELKQRLARVVGSVTGHTDPIPAQPTNTANLSAFSASFSDGEVLVAGIGQFLILGRGDLDLVGCAGGDTGWNPPRMLAIVPGILCYPSVMLAFLE